MATQGPKPVIFTSEKCPFTNDENRVYSALLKLKANPETMATFNLNYEKLNSMQKRRFHEFGYIAASKKHDDAKKAYDAALEEGSKKLSSSLRNG